MRGRVECRALATVVSHYVCDVWIYVVVCDVLELDENRVHTVRVPCPVAVRATYGHMSVRCGVRGAGAHGSV